jgi:hypothetical protein
LPGVLAGQIYHMPLAERRRRPTPANVCHAQRELLTRGSLSKAMPARSSSDVTLSRPAPARSSSPSTPWFPSGDEGLRDHEVERRPERSRGKVSGAGRLEAQHSRCALRMTLCSDAIPARSLSGVEGPRALRARQLNSSDTPTPARSSSEVEKQAGLDAWKLNPCTLRFARDSL